VVLVASIALADAVNPATVAPALYLATSDRPLRRLLAFAGAFFAVNLAGGVAIVLGPGQLLLSMVPQVGPRGRDWIELGAGLLLLAGVGALAASRGPSQPAAATEPGSPGRAAALGATIAALELPTALPYFAAIAAIVGSGRGLAGQLTLVVVFNVVFISPVLVMAAMLAISGPAATDRLRAVGEWLRARWRVTFAVLAAAAGLLLVVLGATGLAGLR